MRSFDLPGPPAGDMEDRDCACWSFFGGAAITSKKVSNAYRKVIKEEIRKLDSRVSMTVITQYLDL